ncbi:MULTISPECIES: multicopper oxidase family protein [Exiguobacterium]|uniref:Multicopper oxidase domain-containing protein n=1 Tax=Exiguobacterium acetylicum TaxID=41170 RepID=A0ABX8GE10_EXIAC|nr:MULTISPECIES: multicopper oxidase domain-containing protein [Exiguobacterium]QWB31885.1 multicopper oxidase domain-containing protein [Exiguobacterium acetylicum]
MKKYLVVLLLLLMVIGTLIACSDSNTMNHSDMNMEDHSNMDEMDNEIDMNMEDHSNMDEMDNEMKHGELKKLKDSKGENEISIPVALKSESDKETAYTIRAQKGKTEFYKGISSDTLGYNGSLLGPMLKFKSGEKVTIRLINELGEDTTFHWHGLEIPGDVDGGPHNKLKPGEERIISFEVKQDAATLWFHPHPEGKTAEQVYSGLAGLIYIEDDQLSELQLPDQYGINDIPLVIQDRMFEEKRLDYQAAKNSDGTVGDTVLINGTVDPKLTVAKEKVRLRLLNGSNARNFTFKLSNGDSFVQIGTDGGLLNAPVKTNELTLTPSERAEIIVDFSKIEENEIALINEEGINILDFQVSEPTTSSREIPEKMNDFEITDEEMALPVTKKIELFGMMENVTINGKKFDAERIDLKQEKGVTEVWEIYNKPDEMGGMIHPFHVHGTQFKIISRDGESPSENEQGWKDTLSIAPGEKVEIAIKFEYEGVYMFHCHILEHEDNGMMGQIKVY